MKRKEVQFDRRVIHGVLHLDEPDEPVDVELRSPVSLEESRASRDQNKARKQSSRSSPIGREMKTFQSMDGGN